MLFTGSIKGLEKHIYDQFDGYSQECKREKSYDLWFRDSVVKINDEV